jgi:hypothetical protein
LTFEAALIVDTSASSATIGNNSVTSRTFVNISASSDRVGARLNVATRAVTVETSDCVDTCSGATIGNNDIISRALFDCETSRIDSSRSTAGCADASISTDKVFAEAITTVVNYTGGSDSITFIDVDAGVGRIVVDLFKSTVACASEIANCILASSIGATVSDSFTTFVNIATYNVGVDASLLISLWTLTFELG